MPNEELEKLKDIFAKNLKKYLEINGKNQVDLTNYMGVSPSTVSDWCNGAKMPRMDKIQAICNWLQVEKSDLLEEHNEELSYYINDDAKEYAQFLFENPEYRVLFSAVRKVSKDDLDMVRQIIDKFKGDDGE